MSHDIEGRLRKLKIELNAPPPPAANYVPYVVTGNLVFISGQVPSTPGGLRFQGKVGAELSLADGQEAARLCAINILAQLKAACGGDLGRVRRCVKLGGFVNAIPEFAEHPAVVNGASNLIVEVLGEAGKHARFAMGAGSLPFDVAVEVDAIFEIA